MFASEAAGLKRETFFKTFHAFVACQQLHGVELVFAQFENECLAAIQCQPLWSQVYKRDSKLLSHDLYDGDQ